MLQIAKNSSRSEQVKDLSVERTLAFMNNVVNGKAGKHNIEDTQVGQRIVEIVLNDCDGRITCETRANKLQHSRREINSYSLCRWPALLGHGEKTPGSCAQIKNAGG